MERSSPGRTGRTVVCVVALVSGLASLAVYGSHLGDFFWGDDFELIGDALAGISPLEPLSTHLRPMIRLHFLLYRVVPSPAFFGALSLLLHAAACAAVFVALRAIYSTRVALPTTLLFFGSFLANEAIFWASSAGVLYCMIFSALALAAFVRGRLVAAYAATVLAALSYELWLVLPVLFCFHHRRRRELIVPFLLVAAWVAVHLAVVGAAGASTYGGFSPAEFPLRFSIYAFRLLSPLAGNPSLALSIVLGLGLAGLAAVPRFRFPLALYGAAVLPLTLSSHVSSRFHYFPSLALILMLALALDAPRRAVRWAGAALAVYLALASPWINALDGEDYRRKAALHRELFDALAPRVTGIAEGQRATVVNRLGPEPLLALTLSRVGRPKLVYVRDPALAGMIHAEDAVRMALWRHDGRPAKTACGGTRIEVGRDADVRSTYCFRVEAR